MTTTLNLIGNCDMSGLEESLQGTYFGHEFSKAYQYVITEEKFLKIYDVSIKSTQRDLQKCITWPKEFEKGRQEWEKA